MTAALHPYGAKQKPAPRFCCNDRTVLRIGQSAGFGQTTRQIDGFHTAVVAPGHDVHGTNCCLVGIVTDITERKLKCSARAMGEIISSELCKATKEGGKSRDIDVRPTLLRFETEWDVAEQDTKPLRKGCM